MRDQNEDDIRKNLIIFGNVVSGCGVSNITCVSSSVYDVIMEWVIMQDSNSTTSYVLETRTSVWEMEIEIFMKEVKLKLCSPEIQLEISVGAREVFYYISYLSLLKSPWNNDQCSDNEHSYCPDDDIKIPFPTKRNQGFLRNGWFLVCGRKCISLDYFVRANSQEAIRDYKAFSKDSGASLKGVLNAAKWNNLSFNNKKHNKN